MCTHSCIHNYKYKKNAHVPILFILHRYKSVQDYLTVHQRVNVVSLYIKKMTLVLSGIEGTTWPFFHWGRGEKSYKFVFPEILKKSKISGHDMWALGHVNLRCNDFSTAALESIFHVWLLLF